MAEFKLGRIRFVWKDEWSPSTTYYVDDVVRYGGRTYICTVGHTSDPSFYVDLEYAPPKWNQLSDGIEWKDNWSTGVLYKERDIVKYGGQIYICATSHTSAATTTIGLEADQEKWQIFAEGIDWKTDWSPNTRYKVNDVVKYGGQTYLCNTGHTSAATVALGLEADQAKWDYFNPGIEYKGTWTTSPTRYKVNDVVKYGAGLWICVTPHTSTSVFADDESNWNQFVKGFEYEDNWSAVTVYQPGDVVAYGGNQYIALTNHAGTTPTENGNSDWSLFTEGFKFQAEWSIATSYKINEVVTLNGKSYIATSDSSSFALTVTATSDVDNSFTVADTSDIEAGLAVEFSGTTFGDIGPSAYYYVKQVLDSTKFTISESPDGTEFVPATASGSMTATISAFPTNTSYWDILSSGLYWKGDWTDDTEYFVGDVVIFELNTYICIQEHRAEGDDQSTIGPQGGGLPLTRPDQDTSGIYWNILATGSETSVLTTQGDLVYFDGAGPTRLSIGIPGQILRASEDGIPEWNTLGETDHVYYVSLDGTDEPAPAYGKTLDRPWKTVKYAAQQVEDGPRNPNAQELLTLNRVFIQREVTEYIQYSIANAGVGELFENFDYEDYKCERDVGLTIDALIWDIGHGGNVKTRGVANSLVGAITEDTPGAYPNLANEKEESIAAYNYMLTVIENVLNNEAPDTNYQTENGDNSTAVVSQYFNLNIEAESGVYSTIQSLVTIVTNALEDEDASRVPARIAPANLIRVATGTYTEHLPIIVPEHTAILGDELRSTNIRPTSATTHISDVKYSLETLGRLETIVGDIVQGNEVSSTTGNTETQSQDFPFADTFEETASKRLVRTIQQRADFLTGAKSLVTTPDPTDYNVTFLTGYGNARKLISYNKKFIQEQVIAYVTANYPNLLYSRTKCRQDVGYIVDAITYDLTYDGKYQSLVAGLAYYEGAVLQFDSSETTATLAAYGYLKTLLQRIATNTTSPALQDIVSQYRGTAGSAAAETAIGEMIDIITGIIENGITGRPNVTISSISTNVITTSADHGLQVGDAFIPRETGNGLIKNVNYWVIQTPATDTLTVSETYNGTVKTLTNGAGLSIIADTVEYGNISWVAAGLTGAAEDVDADQETIVTAVINQLNQVAYHTDFIVREANLTNDDFEIYIGTSSFAYTYVEGGRITLPDTSTLSITNFVYNESTGVATVTTSANHSLEAGDEILIRDVTLTYVNPLSSPQLQTTQFPAADSRLPYPGSTNTKILYNQTKCLRDIRLITEAVIYDFMFGSNFASTVAGISYLRASASDVYDLNQKSITIEALDTVKTEMIASSTDSVADTRIEELFDTIDAIIFGGSNEGSNCGTSIRNRDYAVLQIERNRAYIVAELNAYIADTFSDTATASDASADVITISDTSWLQRNTAIRFTGTLFGGVVADTTYYVYSVESTTTFKIASTRDATTAIEISTGSGSMGVELFYNEDICTRDVNYYLDAIIYDLKYSGLFLNNNRYIDSRTGNYKSNFAARYYANSVTGSLEEDMFYLRDTTGVRDCTLQGLTGDLLAPSELGTSRVSAGAYCSLDPGWGPDDYRAWIINRSPYVQGVTTLGTACVGQKIDGALHNGGNDSITSNDFTQVLSDGIGAWITNNGRAELVSVFTYYGHIGYLAENGGRIRGTNGNCSYGDFGAVAEGFDDTETPGDAVVDNRFAFDATVNEVIVDGDELLTFIFDNAGRDYTEVEFSIGGGGFNAAIETDEFRDDAVFEVRLLDEGGDSSGQAGGEGYITNGNTAQGGSLNSITLAATDGEISSAYPGMKVVITGGTGAGQYALINTYNAGTKNATVLRESDGAPGWDHFVSGTTIAAPDASSTYTVEPALSFTSPGFTATEVTLSNSSAHSDVIYGETTAEYTTVTGETDNSGTGANFTVVKNGWKYIVNLTAGGINYERFDTITISGADVGGTTPTHDITITITAVNALTGAILDFEIEGTAKSGKFVSTTGTTTVEHSDEGDSWASVTAPVALNRLAYGLIDDGTSDLKVGRFVAIGLGGTANAAYSDNGTTWTATTLPLSATWVDVTFGDGKFVAIASDSTTVAISNDGIEWDLTGTLNTTGFSAIGYGAGKFVAVKTGTTNAVEYSTDAISWTQDDMPENLAWSDVEYGSNIWVAISAASNNSAYSIDGITWVSGTIGSPDSNDPAGYQRIEYGQGLFMITSTLNGQTGYQYVMKSENGLYWTEESVPTVNPVAATQHDGYRALAFGNPQRTGYWIAIQNDSGTSSVRIRTGAKPRARAFVATGKIFAVRLLEPGSGYDISPTMTITDPNNLYEAPFEVRTASGVIANPSFVNRGNSFNSGNAEVISGDGTGDFFQPGSFIAVRRLSERPVPGSNVVFDHLPSRTFKLVNVITFLGSNDGSYTAFFQVSPDLSIAEAPDHLTGITTRLRYSQVRLTGHDFLDIGTGNFDETNYPGTPTQDPVPAQETKESNGGRVFYTSTDQDGNFRVGNLFSVEQSTGIATLNADAFNISGLQELNLGNVTLGGGSATVTEFSTDPFFTADSDNVVPTQRAIRAYIAAQIGGGGASLNVNSVTAGSIFIAGSRITHVLDDGIINMNATFDFRGGVTGLPIAFNYFLN